MPKKTKIFITILIIVIFILIIINFLLGKISETTKYPPSPAPTVRPQGDANILEQQEEIRINNYPLLDKTPYKTGFFEVNYVGPLKLRVTMFTEDQKEIKRAVNQWLKDNGINPSSHQIEYISLTSKD